MAAKSNREKNRAYYLAHIQSERARKLAYYRDNRERAIERMRARDALKRSERRAYDLSRKPQRAVTRHIRRARIAGSGGAHSLAEWVEKCALLGNVCFYCGEAKPLTRDHKTPISRGGRNDITNVVPACLHCNKSKRTRTAREHLGLAA